MEAFEKVAGLRDKTAAEALAEFKQVYFSYRGTAIEQRKPWGFEQMLAEVNASLKESQEAHAAEKASHAKTKSELATKAAKHAED
eukprot:487431-Prorocentrum_minimum.AAC.1